MISHPPEKEKKPRRALRGAFGKLLHDLPSHLAFLLALLIVQILYTVLFLSAATDIATVRKTVTETYDYELEYRGMTQPQYVQLYNDCGTAPIAAPESSPYSSIRYQKMSDGSYNAYITLKGITRRIAAENFLYHHGIDGLDIGYTPLYDYKTEYLPGILLFLVVATLAVFALSVFLLIQLDRMRLDRDTFDYAIYMTCGANYRRLYKKTCRELFVLASLTLFPALAIGAALTVALYTGRGRFPASVPIALIAVVLFTVFSIRTAVKLPMRRLSKKAPVELLRARDNANHVVSPRRSRRIFGASFPRDFELLSLWRYRRYFAGLLISTVLMPVLFLGSVAAASIHEQRVAAPTPDFTLTFSPSVVNADSLNENTADLATRLSSVPGVSLCLPEELTFDATAVCGHILLTDRNQGGSAGVYYDGGAKGLGYSTASNAYRYTALDEAAIRALLAQYPNVEGDPYAVLSDDHTILISESINGVRLFDFSVGDKILVATQAIDASVENVVVDDNRALLMQLESGKFAYEEFTVGAVIHNLTPDAKLLFGINFAQYELLTMEAPVRYSTHVYMHRDADFATWENARNAVFAAGFGYYSCNVSDHDVFFDRYITSLSNTDGRLRLLALGFLLMMPLISVFSQRVFYKKREGEWEMLRALGASSGQMLRSAFLDGAMTALVSLLLSLPAMLAGHGLLFSLFHRYLPGFGLIDAVLLDGSIPWGAVIVAAGTSILCGFVPPLVAGLRFRANIRRRTTSLMAGQ